MSSGVNENVDLGEVGDEADENRNVNLPDELIKEENKGIDNVDGDMVEETVLEAKEEGKEQIPAENIEEIPNVRSLETAGNDDDDDDDDAGGVNETEENVNTEDIPIGEVTNDVDMIAMENEDVINEGANDADVDAKENEEGQVIVVKEEKIEINDEIKDDKSVKALNDVAKNMVKSPNRHIEPNLDEEHETVMNTPSKSFLDGCESGTEEEQAEFAKEVKTFYRENNLEYKAPKFYKEELNLLKLWRAVIKLGGYDQVTSSKLWRQVGESFRPPKTCTTVSWTFRIFYEKALLEYEKHKMRNGELPFSDDSLVEPVKVENQVPGSQALWSGRARRDAAARAMQGWHSQRLLNNGEEKNLNSAVKGDKQLKTNGLLKRKKPSSVERGVNGPPSKSMRMDSMVVDVGPPADWVKINVQKTSDCFEIYALVPGLLREEVHVQSDPAGRLIISGEPEQLDNPWGVTAFKKVVTLPSRIDPHQTSAVVTLHGQLFVRVPFEQLDS